jgi:hypothetical protein
MSSGYLMEFLLWISYGIHIDIWRNSYGYRGEFQWASNGIPVDILWSSCEYPMDFPWMSYGVRKISYGIPFDDIQWK